MTPIADWRQIARMSRALAKRCGKDRFLATVLKGSINVGKSKGNPIRGNLAAAGLREAIGHIIHKLSPDEEVRACVWFVQAEDTQTVTRRQRANYIIQAGLPDSFVKDKLKFDVKPYADELLAMVDGLNRSTHVRPNTILIDSSKIRVMFSEVISGVVSLLDAAESSRESVQEAIVTTMNQAVFEKLIGEAIQDLDELSTHTAIEGHSIEEIEVLEMGARQISYRVSGAVTVELQYGSGSDMANDNGVLSRDSFPYEAQVVGEIDDPTTIISNGIDLTVANSSFYE